MATDARRPAGAVLAAVALTLTVGGCGSSDPKPPKHPTLCGQTDIGAQASFGDLDINALNPGSGVSAPIDRGVDIGGLPLPAKATSAAIIVSVPRYQENRQGTGHPDLRPALG